MAETRINTSLWGCGGCGGAKHSLYIGIVFFNFPRKGKSPIGEKCAKYPHNPHSIPQTRMNTSFFLWGCHPHSDKQPPHAICVKGE